MTSNGGWHGAPGKGADYYARAALNTLIAQGFVTGPEDDAAMVTAVTEADLPELLPLVRAYCEFYEVAPSDAGSLPTT